MRTIILFIINLLIGVWCGVHTDIACPSLTLIRSQAQKKLAGDDGGTEAMRILCPTHTTRLPIPTILHRLQFITHLPIRRTPTTDLMAITGLITLRTDRP